MSRNELQEYDREIVIIELSVWKLLFASFLHVMFGFLSLVLFGLIYSAARIVGETFLWLLSFLFGFALIMRVIALLQTVRKLYHLRKTYIRLDESGLYYSHPEQLIAWKEIVRIQFRSRKGASWIDVIYKTSSPGKYKILFVQNYFEIKPKTLQKLLEQRRDRFCVEDNHNLNESVSRLLPG